MLTNLRAVPDAQSPGGYKIEAGPFLAGRMCRPGESRHAIRLMGYHSRNTLSYMKGTLTIRIDRDTARMLARVARLSRRTQSQVARDALRRQLAIELFERLRERVAPFAEAKGLLTDEDVFKSGS